ncbi:unnamed protein product [Boreogadus saida]
MEMDAPDSEATSHWFKGLSLHLDEHASVKTVVEVQGMFPCGTSDGRHDFTESYLFQQLSLNRDFDPPFG